MKKLIGNRLMTFGANGVFVFQGVSQMLFEKIK
jgi:hypothetical protein